MATKKENWWQLLLTEYMVAQARKFKWGEFDCALWVADAVKIMTDVDFASEFRGKYKTENGAIRRLGKKGLSGVVTAKLGSPISITYAQRGDVVLLKHNGMGEFPEALGMCFGAVSVFVGPDGLLEVATGDCDLAWRVG